MMRRSTNVLVYEVRHWDAGPQAHVVTAAGELDLVAAPAIRETMLQLAELGRIHLVVDMTEATFIDSTVIGVLVGRLKAVREVGGSICLVAAEPNVVRTLEISGASRMFTIHSSLAQALGATRPAA